MAKADQGYTQVRRRSNRGGGGRGQLFSTYAQKARKDELASFYIRHQLQGILDVLGESPMSETAVVIRQGLTEEYNESKMTKAEIEDATYLSLIHI